MKKFIFVIGLCVLLLSMPLTPGKTPTMQICSFKKTNQLSSQPADAPSWAKGNFTGVWGITLFGIPTQPIGWISGYYENIGLGKLEAEYAVFNTTNATASLGGIMVWVFFFGAVKNYASGNTTVMSGIGIANQTHYYLRLNAIIGPSYYMHVKYTKFES